MSLYNVGDRVRIIDDWELGDGSEAPTGEMDHWLGQVMTIRELYGAGCYKMEEDVSEHRGEGWFWSDALISGLADATMQNQSFKKGDLQSGDVVTVRNGRRYIVMLQFGTSGADVLLNIEDERGYIPLTEYDDHLLNIDDEGDALPSFDIMECQRSTHINTHPWLNRTDMKTVFKRVETKELTVADAERMLSDYFGITTKIMEV